MEFLTTMGIDPVDIIIFVIGTAISGGPLGAYLIKARKLVKVAGKFLDSIDTPNDDLRRHALEKGYEEIKKLIDKHSTEGK